MQPGMLHQTSMPTHIIIRLFAKLNLITDMFLLILLQGGLRMGSPRSRGCSPTPYNEITKLGLE
jgi:hypothetical protein